MMPDWFYALSPREQRKQVRRWRYYRRYYRRAYGDQWEKIVCWIAMGAL